MANSMDPALTEDVLLPSRITRVELPICLAFNHIRNEAFRRLLEVVSRLGNGWFWVAAAFVLLAADGAVAWPAIRHLAIAAVVSTVLYKAIKRLTARPRPFRSGDGFQVTVEALDEFSFPSGHTLHAVAFTLVIYAYSPILFWVILPFTLLIAMSRVVLGLHYPSDVLAGAAIGAAVASLILQV